MGVMYIARTASLSTGSGPAILKEGIQLPMSSSNAPKLPLVSIGLPVYNGENFIQSAIECLRRQSYENVEIIISDNCSADRTLEICRALAECDGRIRLLAGSSNIGAARNFNKVVQEAKGEFFAWANHDDLWEPEYIERCMMALHAAPGVVLAYARSAKIDQDGHIMHPLNSCLDLDGRHASDRIRQYHNLFVDLDRRKAWGKEAIEGLWIPIYGVIRLDALRRSSLIGNYISSDTVLIEELLMLGAFAEAGDVLFYKRDHAARSMRDSESYDKRSVWFTGRRTSRLMIPRWRALFDRLYFAAVLPRSVRQKAACCSEMLYFYVRRPSEANALAKELFANLLRLAIGVELAGRIFRKW
jgi:glycosyltransferase involved in cell wall biosynthesis